MVTEVLIDSLKIYDRLKSAKLDDLAAKEIASVFGDVVESQLATKKDIASLQSQTSKEIAVIHSKIADVHNEIALIKKDIANLQSETKKDLSILQAETKKDIALIQKDMKEMESRLELKIEQSRTDILKWVIGMMIAQTGIILTFYKLMK